MADKAKDIANIRARLEALEAEVDTALVPIYHGKKIVLAESGEKAIVEIHHQLREAISLGYGGTILIQTMCQKYGIEIPKKEGPAT